MFPQNDKKCRPVFGARDVSKHVLAVAALGVVVMMAVVGCSPFGAFEDFLPSAAELEAFEAELEAFNEKVALLPSISVRIINETSASASVELQAGVAQFVGPDTFFGVPFPGEELFLQSVDNTTAVVAANGTSTGSIKCGEVIGVSVSAPTDLPSLNFGENAFGLFIGGGNVSLSGIGAAGSSDFTGDLVTMARFVRPEEEGIDCETGTLTIRIETLATKPVYDLESGVLTVPAKPGTGTLGVE